MEYSVEWLKDAGVVEVVAEGAVNHEKRKEIFRASRIALGKHDCDKLLINKAGATRLFDNQMTGALELVNIMQGMAFSGKIKIAVVAPQTAPYDEFFQEIARLKDFRVKHFTSREIALRWLCRDGQQHGPAPSR
jgi:hypothetical protein